ncbi:nucleotidyltransferase family protein, partial [Enterocloster asparagiformis]
MRVTGVIAEYNPFHGGHQYQIARAKELSGADYCVVAMSGDFVQRGEPAVYSKYLRARAA